MGDFIRFETMITPILIQILFWIGVLSALIGGVVMLAVADDAAGRLGGVLIIIFGPLVARIYSEIMIVVFRINDHLRQIQHNTARS